MGEVSTEDLQLPRGKAKGASGPPSGEEVVRQEVSRVWAADPQEDSKGRG